MSHKDTLWRFSKNTFGYKQNSFLMYIYLQKQFLFLQISNITVWKE